jgi:segregation and condensation protein B
MSKKKALRAKKAKDPVPAAEVAQDGETPQEFAPESTPGSEEVIEVSEDAPATVETVEGEAEIPAETETIAVGTEDVVEGASEPEVKGKKKASRSKKEKKSAPVAEVAQDGEASQELAPESAPVSEEIIEVSEDAPIVEAEGTPETVEGEAEIPAETETIAVGTEDVIEEASEPEVLPGWELSQVLEAILFASQKPVSVKELQSILKGAAETEKENPYVTKFAKIKPDHIRAAIEVLEQHTADPKRAYEVRESAAGWQLVTKPEYSPWLRQLFPENRAARLSAPAMETLAIIAYRQPITRADLEAVRGVAVDGVMQTLMDRGLVKIAGRADIPGRPLLYETTQNFMEHFGLKNLDDLPNANELRKIQLPKAPVPEAAAPAAEKAPETKPAEPEPPAAELFASPATEEPESSAPQPTQESSSQ